MKLEKLKDILLYGFAGMLFSIPFLVVFGLIFHYTALFKILGIEWELVAAYSFSCGGASFGVWATNKWIRSRLNSSTKEEVLQELGK